TIEALLPEVPADALAAAERAGTRLELLDPDAPVGRWRFFHDLIHQVVVDQTPTDVRHRLHQSAVALLRPVDPNPVELARHLAAAGEIDEARRLFLESARVAAASERYDLAAQRFERLFDLADDTHLSAEMVEEALHTQLYAGRVRAGLAVAERAAASGQPMSPGFYRLHSELLQRTEQISQAIACLEHPAAAPDRPEHLLARARLVVRSGDATGAERICLEGLRRLRNADLDPVHRLSL